MWTKTRASELLGVDFPILQGPFGGGYSTPALAAAISNAGGLGAYGAVGAPPEEIERVVREIRAGTSRPFAINLWVPQPGERQITPDEFARAAARLRPHLEAAGAGEATCPPPDAPFEAQLEALYRASPPVFSFVMGVPDRAIFAEIARRGARSIATATTVDEAVALEAAGANLIVASGSDAGGHRGSFLRPAEQSFVGTMSLVPQIASAVRVPVIAAGGIADGRGIAAALALGAEGVQIGTAFLAAAESGAPDVHKALLGTERARITRITRAYSGRHARGIENELMRALEEHPEEILPFPAQYQATRSLRRAAAENGRTEYLALWAGQAAALARRKPAAEVLKLLADETDAVLRAPRLAAR